MSELITAVTYYDKDIVCNLQVGKVYSVHNTRSDRIILTPIEAVKLKNVEPNLVILNKEIVTLINKRRLINKNYRAVYKLSFLYQGRIGVISLSTVDTGFNFKEVEDV
jgi:hypothetical protein